MSDSEYESTAFYILEISIQFKAKCSKFHFTFKVTVPFYEIPHTKCLEMICTPH